MAETSASTPADIAAFRAFNRLYTRRIGLLDEHLDASPFSLSEARILYELAHRDRPTAAEIGRVLGIDRGQLSRTLQRFTGLGLLVSAAQGRRQLLSLTDAGRDAFAALDRGTQQAIAGLLGAIPEAARRRLLAATATIGAVLGDSPPDCATVELRPPAPGDLGLIIHRQAILYAQEYGWDWTYEALVANILAGFVETFDPAREQAWIAVAGGAIVGSIFLMHGDDAGTAKLRLLYVEPGARGLGVGRTLVDACIARARAAGYARLDLWTNSVLVAARRLYEAAGFRLIDEAGHHSFGCDLIGQTWRRDL